MGGLDRKGTYDRLAANRCALCARIVADWLRIATCRK